MDVEMSMFLMNPLLLSSKKSLYKRNKAKHKAKVKPTNLGYLFSESKRNAIPG
jgi:hypothetical protein